MSDKVFSSEEKAKLTQIINEGMTVLQEVEDLNAGLAETVKAISEEMEIKPTVLKKAIRTAHKGNFGEITSEPRTVGDYSVTEKG